MPAQRLLGAGAFRHRVTLVSPPAGTANEMGETTGSPAPYAQAWAAVMPLSARELVANAAVAMDVTTEVHIRYRTGVTHGMSVLFSGRTFDVQGIVNVLELNAELVLLCNERRI